MKINLIWYGVCAFLVITAVCLAFEVATYSTKPCKHVKPYEVETVGGGVMLIVPEGWYAVPVINKHGRPYMRPTDQG